MAHSADPGAFDTPPRLQREARRYEALISAEGSIVWVVDPDLQPTGRNQAWELYTGQVPEAYARLGWLSAIHPDDRERIQADITRARAAGSALSMEFRIRRADGIYRRNLIRAIPVREDDAIVEWIGTATDVEDARQTADDQRDLRARLLSLTDGAESLLSTRSEQAARTAVIELTQRVLSGDAYAIWRLDPLQHEWRIVHSFGLSPVYESQRVAGEPVAFVQPLAIAEVQTAELPEARRQAYAAEGIQSLLAVPLPVGGARRATLVIYYRTQHEVTETELRVGTALGQIAAAALWNAETYEALHRSQVSAERHAARITFLADASALLGSLDYEATLRELARLAVPQIADWCAVDIRHPDGSLQRIATAHVDPAKVELARMIQERYPTDPSAASGVPNVLRTGKAEFYPEVTDEMLVAGARDAEHLATLRALEIRSALMAPLTARGHTLGVITYVRTGPGSPLSDDDVTVLVEVARRAALAVDNARLYRDAELANRAKDEFLAILSHELRTPLNAVMGWSHMLREGLPEDMTRHAIEVIGRNARIQKQLVEDLLDVARIASGRLELQRSPVDLRDVGRTAVDSVLPAARTKNVTLSFEAAHPAPVSGDTNRLQQMIANLLSNALKFTDPGGRVTVRVAHAAGAAELAVIDTGIGITPDFLPHVFDRFRQADASLTRPYAGLGLGLWVVKQIADAHGGRVHAASGGPGTGTTVTVTLPLA
ncbi:MAG TPA: ATP-binding protein [Vicinamibacterales bacterium]|nr:ATP-binding protein [Vicinamibacterales bacterium]